MSAAEHDGSSATGSVPSAFDELLAELEELSGEAASLQDETADEAQAKAVRDRYFEWYGRALPLVPPALDPKFRDAFEGGQFTNRIKAFLSAPKAPNVLYDPARADNPIAASPHQYSFDRTFRPNADAQRQILIEARQLARSEEPGRIAGDDIFVVHGHAEAAVQLLARTIQRLTGREPVVLREQPNEGRTIIEKFEDHASKCAFAVALLTKDDVGSAVGEDSVKPRARQNVVFEAGFFVGLLGRHRVVMLHEPGVELPSDLVGIVYISLDGSWQLELAREMRAVGIAADSNRL